ncbi:MAG: hypothetical protein KKC79_16045, partial [Gammaproteobacteria bacterium]|nr:hypothetical protein [Gammaproteobacteria bacterium]
MRTDQRIVKGVGLSRLWQLVLVHLLIGTTCVQVASAQEPSNDYGAAGITWQVVNRFPVFKDSERFAR